MSGLEEVTGVRGHDGDKAEHSVRDLMSGILAAIALARGHQVVVHGESPKPKPTLKTASAEEGLVLEGAPERMGLPAGPIQGEPGKSPDAIGPAPSPLAVLGQIEIRVGDSVLKTSQSTLIQDLKEHNESNPGFIESIETAMHADELQANAPAVSIFQDGKLEFYRDSEQTFMSPTFRPQQTDQVIDADIVSDTDGQVSSLAHGQDEKVNQQPDGFVPEQLQELWVEPKKENLVVETVSLAQAESIAGQNSGDSSLSDPTLVAEQATAPKVIKDAVTGEVKGLDGPGESALDVPAKIADRQADEAIAESASASTSTGGSSAGSDPPSDELGGHSLGVASLLYRVMDTCYDPGGGPAKLIGAGYIVERGQDRSITLSAKDGRGIIFASSEGGDVGQNDLGQNDLERLRGIELIASQYPYPSSTPEPKVHPIVGRSRGIELE